MLNKKIIVLIAAVLSVMLSSCGIDMNAVKSKFFGKEETVNDMANPNEQTTVANTLIIGMFDFDTFNPLMTRSETVKEAMEFVYEPLFELNELVQPEPVLAVDYGMSADGKTITINLRNDVKWHDGDDFGVYDVEYTLSQIKNGITEYTELLKDMVSYNIVGGNSISAEFNHPIPNAASLFTFPIVKNGTDMNAAMKPIGTGPYAFSGKISTDRYMLNKFDYYREKISVDGIYIDEAPDMEHYMYMCGTGAFDLSTSRTVDLKTYTPKGSVSLNEYVSNRLIFLGINNAKEELAGLNTRLAMSQLVDREYIVGSILYSRAEMAEVPINPSFWLYNGEKTQPDELSAEGHLRIDAWTDIDTGGYSRTVNGQNQTLDLELLVDESNAEYVQIAEKIAAEFNRYGIKTNVSVLPNDQYIQRVQSKNYDIMLGEYEIPATQDISELLGYGNMFNYNSDDMTQLINQTGMTSNTEELKNLYAQIGEKFTADIPFVPIAYIKECMMRSPKIKNLRLPGNGRFFRASYEWVLK